MECTGTCHHRKPGEFHCHTLGRMLNLSSQGVKNRILSLLRSGLLKRERVNREGGMLLVRFLITQDGETLLARLSGNEKSRMTHPIHQPVVDIINEAIDLMDDFMRMKVDLEIYSQKLGAFDVDSLLEEYKEDFKKDAQLVYYLDALMLLSSLQHQLDFQVAEYGANVASEDMKCLRELLDKFPFT